MGKNIFFSLAVAGSILAFGCAYTVYAPYSTEKVDDIKPQPEAVDYEAVTDFSAYSGLNSKNIGWGFKKEKAAAPEIDEKTVNMFKKTNTYYIGNQDEKVLYLTFDEGYENGYTSVILDVLKEKNVPAAFFITGPYLKTETDLVDRMVNEGHVVGNHTVNHPNLAKIDLATVRDELKNLDEQFCARYGTNMTFARPPEGEYSEKMLTYVADIGYRTVLWSFAYKDWDVKPQKGGQYAFNQVIPYLHNGAILLLHAVSSDNAQALGDIIDYAKEQGFEFKSLTDL